MFTGQSPWAVYMRITGNTPISGVRGRAPAKRQSGTGNSFSPEAGSDSPHSAETTGASTIQGIDALLVLQEVDGVEERRARTARHGHSLLDLLEAVRIQLLTGDVSEGRLNELAGLVENRQSSGDPVLDSVLEEIELRVKVELAKLGRYLD